jgi:hypothetical protein
MFGSAQLQKRYIKVFDIVADERSVLVLSQDAGEPFQEVRLSLEVTAPADHRGLHSVDDADCHHFADDRMKSGLLFRFWERCVVFILAMRNCLYVKN